MRKEMEQMEKEKKAGIVPDPNGTAMSIADPMAMDVDGKLPDEATEEEEAEKLGSKIIVIHPGSQNLRLGLASDALPKSIPNVIAKRAEKAEFEVEERCPKRMKLGSETDSNADDDDDEPAKLAPDPEVSAPLPRPIRC